MCFYFISFCCIQIILHEIVLRNVYPHKESKPELKNKLWSRWEDARDDRRTASRQVPTKRSIAQSKSENGRSCGGIQLNNRWEASQWGSPNPGYFAVYLFFFPSFDLHFMLFFQNWALPSREALLCKEAKDTQSSTEAMSAQKKPRQRTNSWSLS